jgi:hypothetical protein
MRRAMVHVLTDSNQRLAPHQLRVRRLIPRLDHWRPRYLHHVSPPLDVDPRPDVRDAVAFLLYPKSSQSDVQEKVYGDISTGRHPRAGMG